MRASIGGTCVRYADLTAVNIITAVFSNQNLLTFRGSRMFQTSDYVRRYLLSVKTVHIPEDNVIYLPCGLVCKDSIHVTQMPHTKISTRSPFSVCTYVWKS